MFVDWLLLPVDDDDAAAIAVAAAAADHRFRLFTSLWRHLLGIVPLT